MPFSYTAFDTPYQPPSPTSQAQPTMSAPTVFKPQTQAATGAMGGADNAVTNFLSGITKSPIAQGIGNFANGIDTTAKNVTKSVFGQNAPDPFSVLNYGLQLPQRGIFQLAATQHPSGQPTPNFFDPSQDPNSQMSKYLTGQDHISADLGLSLLDPLNFVGGLGEADKAKMLLSTGKQAAISGKGVQALKDLAQETHGHTDLVKLATENGGKALNDLKAQLAQKAESTNPEYIDKGGIKVLGKTVVPQTTVNAVGQKIAQSPVGQFAKNNMVTKMVQELVNPAMTNKGLMTSEQADIIKNIENATRVESKSKTAALIRRIFVQGGKGLDDKELASFWDTAKLGLPTGTGRLTAGDIAGKSIAELKQVAPTISERVLQAYHTYINEAKPQLEALGIKNFNLSKDVIDKNSNYLHEYKPGLLTKSQIFGSLAKPIKYITKSGSTKQAVQSKGIVDEAVQTGKDVRGALAEKGFETNPAKQIGHLAQERFNADAVNSQIDEIVKRYPKININKLPEEVTKAIGNAKPTLKQVIQYYKGLKDEHGNQLHDIYQPKGNLRFYKSTDSNEIKVSSKVPTHIVPAAFGARLNEMRTGNAYRVGTWGKAARAINGGILKFQFAFPQFAILHGLWHLAPNALLEHGYNPNILKDAQAAIHDVTSNSDFAKMLEAKGALPHHLGGAGGSIDDLITKAAGQDEVKKGFLQSIWHKIDSSGNPISNKYIVNAKLSQLDSIMRTSLIRNNIQNKGMGLDEAIKRVNLFMVDYNNLTSTEKSWVKLVIPFYSWTKGNLGAQTAGWIEHPYRQLMPSKVMDILNQQFSGHSMEANQPGQQSSVDLGQNVNGREAYAKPPLSSQDIPSLINNPESFVTGRAGAFPKALSIGATGTEFGYPVVNENSPTPQTMQKAAGIVNAGMPMELSSGSDVLGNQTPTPQELEAKAGILLDPAQYATHKPSMSTFGTLLSGTGLKVSLPAPQQQKEGYNRYAQGKFLKSLRRKGIIQ